MMLQGDIWGTQVDDMFALDSSVPTTGSLILVESDIIKS